MGKDASGGPIPQFIPQMQISRPIQEDSPQYMVRDETECVLITRICATNVVSKLRRIPVGFYVAVQTENGTIRTLNKSISVGKDVVEWDDEIALLPRRSSKISLTVIASFELGPTLGNGEALCEYGTTVGELLDSRGHSSVLRPINGEVDSPESYFEIKVERQVHGQSECAITSSMPQSEEMRQLTELTDEGHRVLIRYRNLQEQRDLDECIKHFERAQDLCPPNHPSRAAVLFNLATAKMIHCRVSEVSADLDVPINLYRDVLRLRPRDHPDHPSTLLSLGVALQARSQRQHNEADGTEGESLLSQVLDIAPADGFAYYTAVVALGSVATPELIETTEEGDLDDGVDEDREVQRLDAALQWTFYPHFRERVLLDHLGVLFCVPFHRHVDLGDPDKAISMLEVVVQFASDDHPDKHIWLGSLGSLVGTRYDQFGGVTDLERLISLYEGAVQSTPDGHSDKPLWLSNLGHSFLYRYKRFGDANDLERSISLIEDVVHMASDDHPRKPSWLINLGGSLLTRYERFGDVTDLTRSISSFEDAVQFTRDDLPEPLWLNNLGHSLLTRYERFGDVTDLKRSISLYEDAVRFTPDDDPDKPSWLNNLGSSLTTCYQRFGDIADLERSITLYEDAVQLTPNDHPDKPLRLNNLGSSFSARYERFGDINDLERSIALYEDVVQFTSNGHPNKPSRLNNLGGSLLARYERLGDVTDLERSISLHEDVVRLTPDDHPYKPLRLRNLGSSLSTRYERFGDITSLERSISLYEDAIQLIPDDHPDKHRWVSGLSYMLSTRYERIGDVTDLERSISLLEDPVQFTPDDHPDKHRRLSTLGHSLLNRYRRFGDVTDLERSISLYEDALLLTPNGHPQKHLQLNNLATSLSTRYECFGDVADLERSISLLEDAVQFTPDEHPDKPLWLNNLGLSLSTRYRRFGNVIDLERSISLYEDAVEITSDGHSERAAWLDNLGTSLSTRFDRFGNVVDLERSISLKDEAVQFTPDDHPDKPLWLNNLGLSLLTRYRQSKHFPHLEKSISFLEDAVRRTPDGHLQKPLQMYNLAHSHFERFQHSDEPSSFDLSQAILCSSHAARSPVGRSVDRFKASQLWIRCVRHLGHDSQSSLDAYVVSIDLLPRLAWMGLSLHDRYHHLLEAADCACEAAAVAVDTGRPELAVEWLEQGRSIVWSQLSQLRAPVDDLRTLHPEIASRFEHVSHQLEHAGVRDRVAVNGFNSPSSVKSGALEKEARQHHAVALSRERLLEEIRALPGFERFLLPKTIKQLASVAHSGPVVFLNASEQRCDALVVTACSEQVIHVPLLTTNYHEVAGMQRRLNDLLRLRGRFVARDSDRGARPKGLTPDDVFKTVLPYLWEKVVGPILEALALSKSSANKPARIFWCPSGPFSFLPIHAAGIYGTTNPGPRLSDFAISSYIPTMSALELPPPDDSETTSRIIRLLAVPQPSTDGQAYLRGVRGEIESIRKLASSSSFVSFQQANGTVEDVMSGMADTDWVHFACHGTQDRTNPYDSGFLLAHGKRLKLSDIARVSRPHGGLAFLSACHTATGDQQLSEEAIHIASGMLLAGYRSVVATMWSILDDDAPRVTEDVYENLFSDGKVPDSRRAAEALHDAIVRLRDSGASFLSWVPFIHVGL